jgi:hypothetical protein
MAILRFPSNLTGAGVPYIKFVPYDGDTRVGTDEINLYMPPAFAIGDGAGYNTVNLGSTVANDAGRVIDEVVKMGRGVNSENMVSLAAKIAAASKVPGSNVSTAEDIMKLNQRKVFNPNTNVAFESMEIRTFSFAFKFMPSSRQEAEQIGSIIRTFRQYMYPDKLADGIILGYPMKWRVEFYSGEGSQVSKALPKLQKSYVTSLSSTYNPESNMWFEDGNPVATDMEISFQEERALTREDV